jgi:tRNA dimethylallyltransferase
MGPTASGKTEVAISLRKRFPFEIVSVDSALVYRGMDIGTAKPDAETLRRAPHRLVDLRDPEESYSAGDFVRDARQAIEAIVAMGRFPLLVGGTMMYFRALTEGIAELPAASTEIREEIDREAAGAGWPAMHDTLSAVDPVAADRIEPNDRQRIQRALEVYRVSGRSLTDWQEAAARARGKDDLSFVKLALLVEPRSLLHERIEKRLDSMLDAGFLDELRTLMRRPGLDRDGPAMRSVGYRQFWAYLAGECSFEEARYRALAATRQLAKRQITWLRAEKRLECLDPLESGIIDTISAKLACPLGL